MKKLVVSIGVLAVAGGIPLLLWWFDADGKTLDRTSDHLLTVLSILAGFMVAVMAAVGEDALQFSKDEEFAEGESRRADRWWELNYINLVFRLCLVSVLLIVLTGPVQVFLQSWAKAFQLIAIFIGLLAALISLGLPSYFLCLHQKRIDRTSEAHKKVHRERLAP